MSWAIPCATEITMRSDGSTECEHIGSEHDTSERGVFGACEFCECEGYTEGTDDEEWGS